MAAVTAAAVAKKAIEVLASYKDGRRALLFISAIAIFILLLPVIVIGALFGCMNNAGKINCSQVVASMSDTDQQKISEMDEALRIISDTFIENGLEFQVEKAQTIYLFALVGKVGAEDFYRDYAECFMNTDDDNMIYDNIEAAFDVLISEEDIRLFNKIIK